MFSKKGHQTSGGLVFTSNAILSRKVSDASQRPNLPTLSAVQNSKAVGASQRLTALPSSPYACRVLGRPPLGFRTGMALSYASVSSFRSKRDDPSPRREQ
jgi:hypothetical protein